MKVGVVHATLRYPPEADVITDAATAGIPQAAFIADVLDISLIYVRSRPKDHGLKNLTEDEMKKGVKVMIVEDLISTGGNFLKAVETVRKAGEDVVGMVTSYTYGFSVAAQAFKDTNAKLVILTDYDHIVARALAAGYVQESDIESLNE